MAGEIFLFIPTKQRSQWTCFVCPLGDCREGCRFAVGVDCMTESVIVYKNRQSAKNFYILAVLFLQASDRPCFRAMPAGFYGTLYKKRPEPLSGQ